MVDGGRNRGPDPVPGQGGDDAAVAALRNEFTAAQDLARALGEQVEAVTRSADQLRSAQARIAEMLERMRAAGAVSGDPAGSSAPALPTDTHAVGCSARACVEGVGSYCPAVPRASGDPSRCEDQSGEIERLRQQLAYKEMLLNVVRQDMARMESLHAEAADLVRGALDSEQVCERPAVAQERVADETPAARVVGDELLIVDDGHLGANVARYLGERGCRARAVGPNLDVPEMSGNARVAGVAINLSTPNAWGALRRLRFSSPAQSVPLLAYALPHAAAKGFWFGAVDFAIASDNESVLIESLQRLAPNLKRVMALSSDFDVMDQVRRCLDKERISVSLVLDGRQVVDMLSVVRPEAVVVHLSPQCMDVFRAVAVLRGQREWRDIPVLFFLDEMAQPRDVAFLTAGVRMLAGRGELGAEELTRTIASAVLAGARVDRTSAIGVAAA